MSFSQKLNFPVPLSETKLNKNSVARLKNLTKHFNYNFFYSWFGIFQHFKILLKKLLSLHLVNFLHILDNFFWISFLANQKLSLWLIIHVVQTVENGVTSLQFYFWCYCMQMSFFYMKFSIIAKIFWLTFQQI